MTACQASCEVRNRILKHTLVAKFRVERNLRFLSHRETLRLFQRALLRAGITVSYSQGFNPHPQLSLPFPRSVGVESDEELLCCVVLVDADDTVPTGTAAELLQASPADLPRFPLRRIKQQLQDELPCGLEVLSLEILKGRVTFWPVSATYILCLRAEALSHQLIDRARWMASNKESWLTRRVNDRGAVRTVNITPFIEQVVLKDNSIAVRCKVTPAGTVRVAEIMQVLQLDQSLLAAPIRRAAVSWQKKLA